MKKTVLITGGSGFLGRNLAVAIKDKYHVVLGARNSKNNEYAEKVTGCKAYPLDVVNIESVRDVLREVKPNIVIHGSATKYVPRGEEFPLETMDINVLGSQNVARVAMEAGVEFVLGISTDKACPPIRNIYGMSKAIMERSFCLLDNKSTTKFAAVRYGNVAWSTGSVLPLWQQKTKEGGPIKVTAGGMRRFFFTVDEAVQLVQTAIDNQDTIRGKVLSRAMKSASMDDLAQGWCDLYGVDKEIIPAREGERMDEYLVGESELEFCEVLEFNGIKHFLISPNEKAKTPYFAVFTSATTERMTYGEIQDMLKAPKDI